MGIAPTGLFLVTLFGFVLGALMLLPQRRAGLPGARLGLAATATGAFGELAVFGMLGGWWPTTLALVVSNVCLSVTGLLFWAALGRTVERPVPRTALLALGVAFAALYVLLLVIGASTTVRIMVVSAAGAVLFTMIARTLSVPADSTVAYGAHLVGGAAWAAVAIHVLRVGVYALSLDHVSGIGDPTPWNTAFLGLLALGAPVFLIGLALIGHAQLVNDQARLASTDFVTGTLSRRAWLAAATHERAERNGEMTLLFLDLDHFKRVNDRIGHAGGDVMLRHVATVLRAQLRADELLGRFGGEEFVVAIPGESVERACELGEDALAALGSDRLRYEDAVLGASFSAGVAVWWADESIEPALRRADVAMYEAKAAGRGRVLVATERRCA